MMEDAAKSTAFETAHARICELIRRFQRYARDNYLQPGYQEAEARKDFIDPLLKALGWDVDHEHEHNPYEQEVKVERGVSVARAHKRADYAFYLKPNYRGVRFFVEAKKPSVDLDRSTEAHFQTLRLRIVCTIIPPDAYFADSTNSIVVADDAPGSIKYVLALLNSRLMQWRFKLTSTNNNVGTNELESMPIVVSDQLQHDRLVSLVDQILVAKQQEAAASGHAKEIATRKCAALDRQIDALVYDLYGLTEAEIALVEDAA
jgi:hypothetical protein